MRRPGLFILLIVLLALMLNYSCDLIDDADYAEISGLTGCTDYYAQRHSFGGGSSRGAGGGGR